MAGSSHFRIAINIAEKLRITVVQRSLNLNCFHNTKAPLKKKTSEKKNSLFVAPVSDFQIQKSNFRKIVTTHIKTNAAVFLTVSYF